MIVNQLLNDDTLIQQWSDQYKMLKQVETGVLYPSPVDIIPCPYTYEELMDVNVNPDWEEGREFHSGERVVFEGTNYESLIDENLAVPSSSSDSWMILNGDV